ncbi:MAG: DUF721 domain-containing protein [Alphaproteobacteria bacterium]|nr:DUF721 domain-containing protein [Alphaproteobacteria bacterium]
MRALAADVSHIVKPVLGKRGFVEGQLVAQWAAVVGSDLARRMLPEKLTFPPGQRRDGTLRLRVAPGFALEAQHREPQILERLNAFFGYRALTRLVLVQGSLPADRPATSRPQRDLAVGERAALAQRVAGIADAELRAALTRLGEAVIGTAADKAH